MLYEMCVKPVTTNTPLRLHHTEGGILLYTFTRTCLKILFCDWLVYQTINHDTMLLDLIQHFSSALLYNERIYEVPN